MRIRNLFIRDFLGAASVDVAVEHPVTLFCGANGSGKSSIRDAVALALTADLGRVSLKKEAVALIRDGADSAVCELTDSDGDTYGVTITRAGKITETHKGRAADPVLSYVLDAQRFAHLDATARRAFLFGLMGVKTDPGDIARRLEALGCHIGKVSRVVPLLRSGFDAAAKEAKAKATEAKGAWRAVTGETYGSEKAKTWAAVVPKYDASAAKALATDLGHCDVAIEQWQRAAGKAQAEEQRRGELRAKLPALKEHAARVGRIEDKLATDETELVRLSADLAAAQAAAGAAPRVGLLHDLARSLNAVVLLGAVDRDSVVGAEADRALQTYESQNGKLNASGGDPAARERLPDLSEAYRLTCSAVAHDKRDLQAAQQAKDAAAAMEAELAEVPDASEAAEAKQQLETLKLQRAEVVKKADAMKSVKAAIDAAEAKTKQAAQHLEDVAQWDAIGDALSPDGIPAEILSAAIGPVNERLGLSAADTGWPCPVITDDMSITADGREYRLLSESERWRVDAMLAETVAHLSGARLLVLDRFDVLDLSGRAELLGWLDVLAEAGEIDTALVFGTLKSAPAILPTTIGVHWIESGVVGQPALKEAA